MRVRDLLDERGLSAAELAALLNERGVTVTVGRNAGRPIDAKAVGKRTGQEIPKAWAEALGLPDSEQPPQPRSEKGPSGEGTDDASRREAPPRRPPEAKVMIEPGARKRIAGAYKFVGAALAAGSGSEGVAEVWHDQADPIAELWIEAAAENPWAARFVNMMSAGGSAGDLAAAHLYLVGATFYVLGAGIPAGDQLFAKYARHRPVVRPPEPPPAAEPERNGQPDGDPVTAPGPMDFDQS